MTKKSDKKENNETPTASLFHLGLDAFGEFNAFI
jgi:hypothetical protein